MSESSSHDLVHQLATERAGTAPGPRMAWERALKSLASTGATPGQIEQIARAAPTAEFISALAAMMGREAGKDGRTAIVYLQREIDASPYPLDAWIRALRVFMRYLEAHSRATSLSMAIGYLHCVVEASRHPSYSGDFDELVEDFLQEHGFTG